VVATRALRGGMYSAVHRLLVASAAGQTSVVLRRHVRPEVLAAEPGLPDREAATLRYLEGVDLPTPRLLGLDRTGEEAGVPALLMSHLGGRVDWWPEDEARWLRRLAAVLPAIHAVRVPGPGLLPDFAPYRQAHDDPPPWAERPAVWERALEIAGGPTPDLPRVLVHRDFHPGNVLWRRGAVSGVVDWQVTSVGPGDVDVGHCRVNLLTRSSEAAARFTAHWEELTGSTYHPWADVVTVVGFLDDLHEVPGSDRNRTEELLARAVAELG